MKSQQQEYLSSKGVKYLLYLPDTYQKEQKLPLMLFLHGSEERGNTIQRIKRNGIPKLADKTNFPFIILSPQCPSGRVWKPEPIVALLKEVIKKTNADENKIYATGLSLGGYGVWKLAITFPEIFAAIAPICGGGNKRMVDKIKQIPVWAFHGAKDKNVPLSESANMVKELKKAGGKVKFTIYTDKGHDVWTETYENKKLYNWFLKQAKNKRKIQVTKILKQANK